MSLLSVLLGQVTPRKLRNPKLSGRPQNKPRYPIVEGKKECACCHEVKDVYSEFSWRTRKNGKSPRSDCLRCEYAKLKEYRKEIKRNETCNTLEAG